MSSLLVPDLITNPKKSRPAPSSFLSEVVDHLNGPSDLQIFKSDPDTIGTPAPANELDLEDVKDQEHQSGARRLQRLEITISYVSFYPGTPSV